MFKIDGISSVTGSSTAKDVTSVFLLESVDKTAPVLTLSDPIFYLSLIHILLSAYINTFLAALYGADTFGATAEIAPVVEEVMKLLPLLFYLLVFEPKAEQIKIAAVITALSFATFENVCYLIQNGAGHFSFIFFRGIGTGAMHVILSLIHISR